MQIARRLRAFREYLQISRTAFSLAIGIGSERLASYEAGRVALKYEVFAAISKKYFIRPWWLATGETAIRDEEPFDDSAFAGKIGPKDRFIDVFDSVLRDPLGSDVYEAGLEANKFAQKLEDLLKRKLPEPPLTPAQRHHFQRTQGMLELLVQHYAGLIGEQKQVNQLTQAHESLSKGWQKKDLTTCYAWRKYEPVKSPMKVLLGRVALATKARGKKAALAKFLHIPPPRVSEWLHGAGEPSGEITLRLLEWVTAEEAQQKEPPGGVKSSTGGKTHLPKEQNANRKSGNKQK